MFVCEGEGRGRESEGERRQGAVFQPVRTTGSIEEIVRSPPPLPLLPLRWGAQRTSLPFSALATRDSTWGAGGKNNLTPISPTLGMRVARGRTSPVPSELEGRERERSGGWKKCAEWGTGVSGRFSLGGL